MSEKKARRFIRFTGFSTEAEIAAYCAREGITNYVTYTGDDGLVRGSGEIPETSANRQGKQP